jgi:phosphonate transport system substrate-binding protein
MTRVHNDKEQPRALRFATFLSPNLYGTYENIARHVGEKLGCRGLLSVGQSFDEFAEGRADVGFMCGLFYARMARQAGCPIELLAAPVLHGRRYAGRPIYFSDVIVRKDSPFVSFDDLGGCVWAYNEFTSHSGWNLVYYSLLCQGRTPGYFGRTIKSGSHLKSLHMVLDGQADATAIDSHVLDVLLQQYAELGAKLRVIETLGPSGIPPVVVAKRLDESLKYRIQAALLQMHNHRSAADELQKGMIERFVPVTDELYAGILEMLGLVEMAIAL